MVCYDPIWTSPPNWGLSQCLFIVVPEFSLVWLLEETTFLTHCLIQLCYKQAIQYHICLDYLGVKKKHLEAFSL